MPKNAPTWVAPAVERLASVASALQARYAAERACNKTGSPMNPNEHVFLQWAVSELQAGRYAAALERLGSMVGRGRSIGRWAGGDARKVANEVIDAVRAQVPNEETTPPTQAEREAGQQAFHAARYFREAGMGSDEVLENYNQRGRTGPLWVDSVRRGNAQLAPHEQRCGERRQLDEYVRDGALYTREWSPERGFYSIALVAYADEPLAPPAAPAPRPVPGAAASPMDCLFHKGEIVLTSYGTGPFQIVDISGPCCCPNYNDSISMRNPPASAPHLHLVCKSSTKTGEFYLNGFLPTGKNVWNDDFLIFPFRSQPFIVLQQNPALPCVR